jgi:myosin heavy subunit
VIAGIVYDSRPAVCDVQQLIKAQARNFEKAHKELASDLSKIKQDETRKIQQARRLLEKKMEECDDKSRELDSRIKATAIFGDVHESVAALEHALEESHSDNKTLKDRIKTLESTLKDMVSNGITHSSLKGKGIVTRIKTEPSSSSSNPAKSPLPSSGYNSASSATSIPTSRSSSSCVASPMIELEVHRIKRELSPASRYKDDDFVFKKPKSYQTPWAKWNSDGIHEADEFVKIMGKNLIQSKSVDDLNYFRGRLTEALDDFKNLFPKDLTGAECAKMKDEEVHEAYHNLRLDLEIPGINERTCSVHFYYGKVLGCINNTLNKPLLYYFVTCNNCTAVHYYTRSLLLL